MWFFEAYLKFIVFHCVAWSNQQICVKNSTRNTRFLETLMKNAICIKFEIFLVHDGGHANASIGPSAEGASLSRQRRRHHYWRSVGGLVREQREGLECWGGEIFNFSLICKICWNVLQFTGKNEFPKEA